MILLIVVLLPIILIIIRIYKKSHKISKYGLSIYQYIINILHKYYLKKDLEYKIFSISFDNASNNIKSIDYFIHTLNSIMDGKMFYKKCACHILSLTVKTRMKKTAVDNFICKFKDDFSPYLFK
jgi:hypothetical protein